MATKISQKPKITRKSPAKPKSIGGGPKKAQHVAGLHRQEKKTASSGRGKSAPVGAVNKMPAIVEYPGERRGKGFGKGVKVVGFRG